MALRFALVVGAFFFGVYAAFFALILITWDQGVIDFVTLAIGVGLAAVTFFKTKRITHPEGPKTAPLSG